ncbi:MAG TPA: PorP/SprF family type IX secretion system membrane protein [Chitinophagaceae bacterium]|jgi:type IX secretion system PorP/SprF family membrane protein|nr:PorP/SprF family type IX secretion system membrane protein [Chitinophagaceae bacterium]
MKKAILFIGLLMLMRSMNAQDPSFSQFFSSPLNINPALTARINSDWRVISNFRDQWIGPASPYATGTISYDTKVLQNKIPNVHEEKNTLGLGGMLMYDYAMDGIMKSVYASANMSYNIVLADGPVVHRLGTGFGATYGRRTVDFSRLTWEEQWVGYAGFNKNLPTGETALVNMKGFFSANAGLVYSMTSEKSNLDVGVAGFHLNTPKQTYLEDPNQRLAMRQVVHANFETFLNPGVVLNVNGITQFQKDANYYSFGAGLGYYVPSNPDVILNAGVWYWSKNAVIPYIGFAYKDFQLGLSYDVTISKLNQASIKPKTFELSLIYRGTKDTPFGIPCPWK